MRQRVICSHILWHVTSGLWLMLFTGAHLHSSAINQIPQSNTPTFTQLQVAELLNTAGTLAREYTAAFKNLMAEEVKTFELFDKSGKVTRQRRIVSDFVVYQSQQDPSRSAEYRSVREVDGVAVAKREQRVEKVIANATKASSVGKELDRINREGTRYDFGYNLTGYTIHKGLASWKGVRQSFRFEVEGRAQIEGHDAVVLKFEQTEPRRDLFNVDLPKELRASDARLRGHLWLDAATGQLWREHHEIVFRSPYASEPLVLIRTEYDFGPSDFGIWLPRRVVLHIERSLHQAVFRKINLLLPVGGRVLLSAGGLSTGQNLVFDTA